MNLLNVKAKSTVTSKNKTKKNIMKKFNRNLKFNLKKNNNFEFVDKQCVHIYWTSKQPFLFFL